MSKKHSGRTKHMNMPGPVTRSHDGPMLKSSGSKNILYALIAGTAIVIALGLFMPAKKPSGVWVPYEGQSAAEQFSGARVLTPDAPSFDFGRISMAKGKVSHRYSIRNSGETPLTITKIFTSCMCTTATFITRSAKKIGPFGMPGHGVLPSVSERLAPGEEAIVDVVFDPAAHGPAGVGPTQRSVTILNDAGLALELRLSAMVTP
jgi:hypothetical protein